MKSRQCTVLFQVPWKQEYEESLNRNLLRAAAYVRQAVVLLDIRKVNRRSKEETAVEGNERQPGLLRRHILWSQVGNRTCRTLRSMAISCLYK